MKRVVVSILLAIVFASIPVFAESREAPLNGLETEVISTNAAPEAPTPQMRRRHRRRMFRIARRRHRVRHYRRIRLMRRRGRR
jgi:hypothetical protein